MSLASRKTTSIKPIVEQDGFISYCSDKNAHQVVSSRECWEEQNIGSTFGCVVWERSKGAEDVGDWTLLERRGKSMPGLSVNVPVGKARTWKEL